MTTCRGFVVIGSLAVTLLAGIIAILASGPTGSESLSAGALTLAYATSLPPVEVSSADFGDVVASYLHAYPGPDAVLSVTDYHRGFLQTLDQNTTERFNICIYTATLRGRDDRACNLPPVFNVTPDPNCRTLAYLSGTDFRPYIHIFLDGQLISGGSLGAKNTAEVPGWLDDDEYLFCYRVPLESGIHTLRYEFEWASENIANIDEWAFTLTP